MVVTTVTVVVAVLLLTATKELEMVSVYVCGRTVTEVPAVLTGLQTYTLGLVAVPNRVQEVPTVAALLVNTHQFWPVESTLQPTPPVAAALTPEELRQA